MSGGGRDPPPPVNGGSFLLQLLQNPPRQSPILPQSTPPPSGTLSHDPAVAAVGPTLPFSMFPPSNAADHVRYHHHQNQQFQHQHHQPPIGFAPHLLFSQNPNLGTNFSSSPPMLPPGFRQHQQQLHFPQLGNDIERLGLLGSNSKPTSGHLNDQNLIFGTFNTENQQIGTPLNGNLKKDVGQLGRIEDLYGKDRNLNLGNARGPNDLELEIHKYVNLSQYMRGNLGGLRGGEQERSNDRGVRRGQEKEVLAGSYRPVLGPPGFTSTSRSGGNKDYGSSRRGFDQNVDKGKNNLGELNHRNVNSNGNDVSARQYIQRNEKNVDFWDDRGARGHLDFSCPPAGVTLNSVSASDVEDSLMELHGENGVSRDDVENNGQHKIEKSGNGHQSDLDDLEEQLVDSLGLDDISNEKDDNVRSRGPRNKDYRSDKRGKWLLAQRLRISKRQIVCRSDINRLNAPFLAIYESLIPAEEEKAKQKQLLTLLETLVTKEWPNAQLYVYGSCANSFGFSKSDIDVCLAIQDMDIDKSEVLLKLAEILESDNLQNVQALTRARVPIVKLMDPITGISCDICINNVLAVINTKLLRDYAQIDSRLRQLAFIVKHWAKSRGVNETYQGTLSSYAYVLMCIHFLQQRRPAILPCLQEMEATYSVTVDNIECAYFDQVERLHGFGSQNGESIAKLVWAFFNYWAYCHDYTNDVISVRTGHLLSKRVKDWTRRIGNDRHLICIEDPFETSHDLGRVVDKSSIRVLREEFERAAEIMQYDPDPCVKLFEPYIPS